MDALSRVRSPSSSRSPARRKRAAQPAGERPSVSELQQRVRMLEAVAENFPGGLSMFGSDLKMVLCNDRLKQLLDYSDTLFANGNPSLEDLFRYNAERGEYGAGDIEGHVKARMALVRRRVPHSYERTRPNGRVLEVRGVPVAGGGFLTTYVDVTEEHRRRRDLEAVVENFPGGICMFDRALRMVVCNTRLKTMLDYPDELFEEGGPTLEELFRFNAGRGEYGPGDADSLVRQRMRLVRAREPHAYERTRPNGTVVEVRGIPLEDGGFVTTYVDVTERHRAEARIAHLAHHDPLTDLPNRLLVRERLEQALAHVKRAGGLAVHYLDLDLFKPVNDRFGHAVGDMLLRAVASRLRSATREVDTVGRIGGDEFVLVQTGVRDRHDAEVVADRLLKAVSREFELNGQRIAVGVTIGIAMAPEHGTTADELMARSDLALYEAKEAGRGRLNFAKDTAIGRPLVPVSKEKNAERSAVRRSDDP
jgi:diguanylate cyclase (GGDEF)-like protein